MCVIPFKGKRIEGNGGENCCIVGRLKGYENDGEPG